MEPESYHHIKPSLWSISQIMRVLYFDSLKKPSLLKYLGTHPFDTTLHLLQVRTTHLREPRQSGRGAVRCGGVAPAASSSARPWTQRQARPRLSHRLVSESLPLRIRLSQHCGGLVRKAAWLCQGKAPSLLFRRQHQRLYAMV